MEYEPGTATGSERRLVHHMGVQGARAWDSLGFQAGRWGPNACLALPHHAWGGQVLASACGSGA